MAGIGRLVPAATEVPFGSAGQSGMGHEGGPGGIADHVDTRPARMTFPED